MNYLYKIVSGLTKNIYVGITKDPAARMRSHRWSARSGKKTPLYDAMRKHGAENFDLVVVASYDTWDECCKAEAQLISDIGTLNVSAGGNGGYVVPINKREEWIRKLKKARKGATPFKGHQHTSKTKKICSDAAKKYWDAQQTYDPISVASLAFKDANKVYGISRTHYYRLKRMLSNDQH